MSEKRSMDEAARQAVADWYSDPMGKHELRYWDGTAWTDHVFNSGTQSIDPLVTVKPSDIKAKTDSVPVEQEGQTSTVIEKTVISADASPPSIATASVTVQQATKVPFFGARKAAQEAQTENLRLQALVDQYGLRDVAALEAAKDGIARQIEAAQRELTTLRTAIQASETERAAVAADVVDLRGAVHLQEFGLYDNEHPAESSVSLATELESLRLRIKQAVRDGQATTASAGFTFNNSKTQGDRFVRDMSKLMLRSYNAEAENCLKSVRAGNLATAQKRLSTTVDQVERLGKMIDLHITPQYHRMRLQELELASRHLQALQIEKELERERRQELREQKQAEQELAREKERLQKERAHYANVLAALIANGDVEGADRMRAQLSDVEQAIQSVDYRAANFKAGYIYVISNIGAFGPDVVKIGMTRRLEPMDRVNELGDASVPFRFDVHALFFADNALSIEAMLHQHFADRRLNRVNLRREYFRATPAEVLDVLTSHRVEVLEYTVEPTAAEYRSSIESTM